MSTSTEGKAPTVEPTAPIIKYAVLEDGKVTREDKDGTVTVATLKSGFLVLVPEWAAFRPAIVRYLNEQGKAPKGVVLEGEEEAALKRMAKPIPPMPKKNPRLGDKTPEVVEWYRKYKPEEFKARYGVKGQGTVTKTRKVIDPKTGQLISESYEVDALISERKTHLTETPQANEANVTGEDSEYDYSLDQAE